MISKLNQSILILGSSSFLADPLIKKLNSDPKYKIVCNSRKNKEFNIIEKNSNLTYTFFDYSDKSLNFDIFKEFDFVVNFVNSGRLKQNELKNFRSFLSKVLSVSKASLIHTSSANVVGKTKDSIVNEKSECSPKNSYILKLNDEIHLKKIAKRSCSPIYILRPTEIIGNNSLNARKLVRSRINDSWFKKYIEKSLYGLRPMHYVSSEYLIQSIFKIIEGKVIPNTYIVSQDLDKDNNYLEIIKIIDSIIDKKENVYLSKIPTLNLQPLFRIIYSLMKPKNFNPYIKFISLSPIIKNSTYKYFRRDLENHIKSILEQ